MLICLSFFLCFFFSDLGMQVSVRSCVRPSVRPSVSQKLHWVSCERNSSYNFRILVALLGEGDGVVVVFVVHLFVSYAHVNLCRFFSSSWCRRWAAASACGYSWTFLFTVLYRSFEKTSDYTL